MPLMQLLGEVGAQAAERSHGLFTKQQFVQGVLQELSMCLCSVNAVLKRGVAACFVKASGIAITHGVTQPSAEVTDTD
jgi:hypothetical protein